MNRKCVHLILLAFRGVSYTFSCWFSGIASSGGNCTTADEPGIFEDVSLYSDWIKKTMEEAGYPYQF